MPRFFVSKVDAPQHILTGQDAAHVIKSLRMRPGESLTLCDESQTEHLCEIKEIRGESVILDVQNSKLSSNEPSVRVSLYQALPKSDKMDLIVQKAVELGVHEIVPVLSDRCISRPDEKSKAKKIARWQKIATEAAKQSRRGLIPVVSEILPLNEAILHQDKNVCAMVFYENGGKRIETFLHPEAEDIAIFVGPEGGFEESEISLCEKAGIFPATLGPRILRTETAPLAALSVIMALTGNM